jgi:type I restriction enzyme S subunit
VTELPAGWASCTVADTMEFTIGGVWGEAAGAAEVDVDVIRVTEMKAFGRLAPETAARRSVTMSQFGSRLLQAGDLVLEKSGGGPRTPVGRVGMVTGLDRPAVCSNFMQLMRPNRDVVTPRFLLWQLVNAHVAGVTASLQTATTNIRNLKMKDYWEVQLSVPPLTEQERIVAAIEEAFSQLDAGEAGLRTVRHLLKRMRNAVLAAAVTGRLVPQDPTDTPATELLADLGVEATGSGALGALPDGWAWAALGSISESVRNGIFVSRPPETPPGVPILRIGAVRRLELDLTDVRFARVDVADPAAARALLLSGDLLFTRYNGNPAFVGACAVVPAIDGPLLHPDKLIRVVVNRAVAEPTFVATAVAAGASRSFIEGVTKTTAGQAGISGSDLRLVPIPLAPVEEQRRIVAEVERQFSFLDACEGAIDAGLVRSAALRRSVLKAAFEGKLVPQDPRDEPASALLERIGADRAAAPPPARRTRRTA